MGSPPRSRPKIGVALREYDELGPGRRWSPNRYKRESGVFTTANDPHPPFEILKWLNDNRAIIRAATRHGLEILIAGRDDRGRSAIVGRI